MSIFTPKLLAFYAISTVGAIALFVGITNYGEKNLKAAPLLVGTYRIEASNLHGCLKERSLLLSIQQSGVYMSGILDIEESTPSDLPTHKAETKSKPSLIGNWQNQQLTLAGTVTKIKECDAQMPIMLKAELVDKNLKGTIALSGETSNFTALRQEPRLKPTNSH
ncbi:hypothetical protein V2H45_00890 [Tumidithrix elongata RA019]|uniref:Uncharacterized protein n=1 Tax=Tumidithrix elongata BACA0141 TaxID=2716417 RepID=A0AAW9PPX5_9CYAN|nr:hypothetical protein [Tumidithrix elongata RA019]